jgi:glycosyltransferase involved in cell wall biosynthesis
MRAVAIVTARNEAIHIVSALAALIAEGLEVILIDHESTDETVALARLFLGRGLLGIERLPWTGRFSLVEQLEAKERVIEQLDCDWIVHADADERLTSPVPGQTLIEGLRAADQGAFNAVHFSEFVFVPRRGEDLYRQDYRRYATRYYFYRPTYPYLQRAWKHRDGLSNREYAGHLLTGTVRQYPLDFRLRHYIVLSEEHAVRKYVGRPFSDAELARGFHYDRVGLTADALRFPADDAPKMRTLPDWTLGPFDTSEPVTDHFWRWTDREELVGPDVTPATSAAGHRTDDQQRFVSAGYRLGERRVG